MIAKLLILHFIADFVLQTRDMGTKKSSEWRWLLAHLAVQFVIFAPFTSVLFALANCAVHGVIDVSLWNIYKWTVKKRIHIDEHGNQCHSLLTDRDTNFIPPKEPQWRFWEDSMFFMTIGFDQLLHGLTLVILAEWML